jgi:superfamily I DNA and/or RNA helicase
MVSDIQKGLNKLFGTPSEVIKNLKEISQSLSSLDNTKLKLLQSVLDSAATMKGNPEELKMLLELIKLITGASIEQLTVVKDITANIVQIVQNLPEGGIKTPIKAIKEIVEEYKKSG